MGFVRHPTGTRYRRSTVLICGALAWLTCNCESNDGAGNAVQNQAVTTPSAAASTPVAPEGTLARDGKPPLELIVIIDQLASAELLRCERHLDARGGLGRAIRGGTFYERARYPFAATLTAPGHATLATGVAPSEHGVSSNEVWSYEANAMRPSTHDEGAKVLTSDERLGPAALRAATVAEELAKATKGSARIVALSIKDRGAIFSIGRTGKAFWYESEHGRFTTSTAYAEAIPRWLEDFQNENPIDVLFAPWTTENAAMYRQWLGDDAGPAESKLGGFGNTFPHDPKKNPTASAVLKFAPALTERLFDLGRAAVEGEEMGKDDVVDLLVLSLSGLDYAGHAFGPRSWEYVDHLLRYDRALGAFLDELETRFTVHMMVSADHGIGPSPETLPKGEKGGRVFTQRLTKELNRALSGRFGAGPWVRNINGSFVYFDASKKKTDGMAVASDFAVQWLSKHEGIARVVVVEDLRVRGQRHENEMDQRVALTLGPDVEADLYLVPEPHYVLDWSVPPGTGSHHGSPYDYDTDVPVLIFGEGVQARRVTDVVDIRRFAPTLAKQLGIAPPKGATLPPL